MTANALYAKYRFMKTQPLLRLLTADNNWAIIGMLQIHLYENERTLPSSIFCERINRELETLRADGNDFPQTAQAYIADWLSAGYLERRYPAGAAEEVYELSTAAIETIRFLSGIERTHSAATESRLSLVMQALSRLADDTDTDKIKRIERLEQERMRIDDEIKAIERGAMRVLPEDTALERTREIIALADGLTGDFRRVRDQFERLNRDLREQLIKDEERRGNVLEAVFAGMDVINDSDEGRTFLAFYRLLTDIEQSSLFEEALDNVMSRQFVKQLTMKEKKFLLHLIQELLEQSRTIHEVMQSFARSLKKFVQSREYYEQRRINKLLNEAQAEALSIKDKIKVTDEPGFALELPGVRIKSLSQFVYHDPSIQSISAEMQHGEIPDISTELIAQLVAQSEIDFRTLKTHILSMLETHSQVSIADVLSEYPAEQGLGSIVGFISLGSRLGHKADSLETVSWIGNDEQKRSARIPKFYFTREVANELAG